jgi:16S rRNA processing protein RimM
MSSVNVAKVGKTVGLGGFLKLILLTDFPEQIKKGAEFDSVFGKLEVESFDNKKLQIKFKHYNTREEANRLVNIFLTTTIQNTRGNCKLSDGEYFWFDIIGLECYEDDMFIGDVVEVDRYSIDDMLVIKTKNNRRFIYPFNKHTVKEVDLKNKKIKLTGAIDILEAL